MCVCVCVRAQTVPVRRGALVFKRVSPASVIKVKASPLGGAEPGASGAKDAVFV